MSAPREESGRYGLLEPSTEPPAAARLQVEAGKSPDALLRGIVRSTLRWTLPGAAVGSLGGLTLALIPPAVGRGIQEVFVPALGGAPTGQVLRALALTAITLTVLYIVMITCDRFGGRLGWSGMQRATHDVTVDLAGHVMREGAGARQPGQVLSRLSTDVPTACRVLFVLVYTPEALVGLLTTVVILWALHPVLGVLALVAAPLVLLVMNTMGGMLERRTEAELEAIGASSESAADALEGMETIRGLRAQDEALRRYTRASRTTLRASLFARSGEAAFEGTVTAVSALFSAALCGTAAYLALNGQLGIGALATVAGLSLNIIGPLGTLATALVEMLAGARAAARRLVDLADGNDRPGAPGAAPEPLALAPGLTVMPAVPRAEDPLWSAVRALPGALVAPRAAEILAGTVRENVALADGPDRDGGVQRIAPEEALTAASLTARELSGGYDGDTGEAGSSLSGGQRQRIALARALAADPEVLVLVDPTTSVDAVTEQQIAERVRELRAGRRTLVVSSSPAFAALADQVMEP